MAEVQPYWLLGALPFVALLLCIAVLPLIPFTSHWWHHNKNKAIVAGGCGLLTLLFVYMTEGGAHAGHVVAHTILDEYIPFMALLGSLYVVAGGIVLRGDLAATPRTNTLILGVGAVLASVLGTTGASMLLIRLLLDTNRDRTRVAHTVVFFIFLVANVGGTLLPIGDPPLFLGYLRGVPFFWTLQLWQPWLFTVGLLLAIYYAIDSWMMRHEPARAVALESTVRHPLHIGGRVNFVWLAGILAAVILLVPGQPLIGTTLVTPDYAREVAMILMVLLSLWATPSALRKINAFSWSPIVEVAVLFIGIFLAMQVPLEVLAHRGADLGITTPTQFFWIAGILSSVLDNAPTYLVFLTTATALPVDPQTTMIALTEGVAVSERVLVAISLGAVFMGANTYIGNGPNFMVKAIAEGRGVKMPGFFGYMGWAAVVLIPVFVLVNLLFVG
ncbi:MAG: sodium:proton antiporter [Phycisphaerales bacterium]|nr:sodium:proton antiporter [Phycisphaerales bacterium]